jgi:hypothetical protein
MRSKEPFSFFILLFIYIPEYVPSEAPFRNNFSRKAVPLQPMKSLSWRGPVTAVCISDMAVARASTDQGI